ncbi:hypothetical protein [Deinococcus yunweiensis]|uniref:hypothetical protein n=1 Tax=Deinococcus yunweiensis TaxID=367282 RepID=UPI00398E646C
MYQHVRFRILDQLSPGTRLLLGGHVYRHARHSVLIAAPHIVRIVGDPPDWLPQHGQRLEVWGELLSAAPPTLLLHGARPLGTAWPIAAPSRPRTGPFERVMQVTEHGEELLGTTADRCTYQLGWPGGRAGVYVIQGHLSGLSPPRLSVQAATRIWPAARTDLSSPAPRGTCAQELHDH